MLIDTVVLDGEVFDVRELALDADDPAVGPLRCMAPTAARQAALHGFGLALLVLGAAGVVVLSVSAHRRHRRQLLHLAREARAVARGGRLSCADVDVELFELVMAFNDTLDQLEAAYLRSEGFSADVAHELRSPLATLIGGTQLALSRPRPAEVLREALASNLEELERLKHLVNDMLFLARADRGERARTLERTDLGMLADTMIDYCGALFEDAGLQAERIGDATAVCNQALISRAMANLLSNAIHHAQGERRIALHLEALPGKVRIWVFNSGAPLPPEVAGRMFDRFWRASASRSEHVSHHGLGLAIVQAVACMHGGSVFVQRHEDGNGIGFEIPSALASGQVRVRDVVNEAPGWRSDRR
jgi:two-component system heavy metal sensor histidine kinase CusS